MRQIPAIKMSGTGNDFVMVDNRAGLLTEDEKTAFVASVCRRRVSVGADGAILVEPATIPDHDFRMRYYNANGGEAEMCGNGSRCVSVFARRIGAAGQEQRIQTRAGTLLARVGPDDASARVRLSQPGPLYKKWIMIEGTPVVLQYINTGVPHAVEFVDEVSAVDVRQRGAEIRGHSVFGTAGTNANFVELLGEGQIRIRTYERGVEDETLACGTGATACAIATAFVHGYTSPLKVHIASGDALTIHFKLRESERTSEPPLLEGAVDTVFSGYVYWGNGTPGTQAG
jgi:diaminopimelate epimerase